MNFTQPNNFSPNLRDINVTNNNNGPRFRVQPELVGRNTFKNNRRRPLNGINMTGKNNNSTVI